MSILDSLRSETHREPWEGTLADYLEIVKRTPDVADLSHKRIWKMIEQAGIETTDQGTRYHFFDSIYGIDETIEQIADYFRAAAQRLDIRKRILLLMGPVASAKSTIATLLKKGLEDYSNTHPLYAIKGCPLHEDPLHLIPSRLRAEFRKEYGVHIEGDLCPQCNYRLQTEWRNLEDIPAERIYLSEANQMGIGSYAPSHEKTMTVEDLVGSSDLRAIAEFGDEGHPMAWRFNGVLEQASRGMLDLIEGLKYPTEFLYTFLTLAQEQNIKAGRFALFYADEVLLMHTNENEYQKFVANKANEAIHNRIVVIKVPYNLALDEEIKIYRKLVDESDMESHIAPGTLEAVSRFAILSRVKPDTKYSALVKLALYNGEEVSDMTQRDVKDAKAVDSREGLDGVSARQIMDALSSAVVSKTVKCVNPLDAMLAIKEGFDRKIGSESKEQKEKLTAHLMEARKLYDKLAIKAVNEALVESYGEGLQSLLESYLDNVEAYVNKAKIDDPITGEPIEPDERYMRSIEEQIGVQEALKRTFREEIMIHVGNAARRNKKFDATSHSRLNEALEKKLFGDQKHTLHALLTSKTPDAEQTKKRNALRDALLAKGYCEYCSSDLVHYVGRLLQTN